MKISIVEALIAITTLSAGCSVPIYEIYIDMDCPFLYEGIIESAIDDMNSQYEKYSDDQLIEYLGTTDYWAETIEDIKELGTINDGKDVAICSTDDIPDDSTWGHGVHDGDIILLTERIDLGYEYRVAMHELGHYVGMGHSEDPASVMYPSVTAQQAKPWFTDADWGSIQ